MSSIAFIDSRVMDYQQLIAALPADTEWFVLNGEEDGVAQMARVLSSYSNLDSLQVLSHGRSGTLYLGATVLSAGNLSSYESQLQAIGSSLSASGDILLYGCDVGADEAGQTFIDKLASLTGADVAASTGTTGSAALGGDWELELQVGQIEAMQMEVALADTYAYLLADDYAASTATTGTVVVGGSASGNIEVQGDVDWFKVTLAGGQTYTLEARGLDSGSGSLPDPVLTLFNGSGVQLAEGDDIDYPDNLDTFVTYQITTGGTYFIGIRSYDYYDYDGSLPEFGTYRVVVNSSTQNGTDAGDSLTGGAGDDTLFGLAGNDTMFGGLGNDQLFGGLGNDVLDGGADADQMSGGAGADIYYVDDIDDEAIESDNTPSALTGLPLGVIDIGNIIDKVVASVNYTLTNFVEDLTLASGTAPLTGTGNTLNNTLTGNNGNNTLIGLGGNDTLVGNAGADTLNGGSGADRMLGGSGADTVVLNVVVGTSSASSRLVVTGVNNDKGQDTLTSFSLTEDTIRVVATNVANFVHGTDTSIGVGTGAEVAGDQASFSTATGLIELNQTANNNWADAGDIAVTFVTPSVALTQTNFEARLQYNLTGTSGINTLTGGARSDTLSGGAGTDTLSGSGGNDLLLGGTGNDRLTGGTGQDKFRFDTVPTSNIDTITDFLVLDDSIQLENAIFTKLTTAGTLSSSFFRSNASGLAADGDDYVLYENDTGKLFYDADGSGLGTKIQIATLVGLPALTSADFLVT